MPADIDKLAGLGGTIEKGAFRPVVEDFYLTNPIARASAVMADCSALAARQRDIDGSGVADRYG